MNICEEKVRKQELVHRLSSINGWWDEGSAWDGVRDHMIFDGLDPDEETDVWRIYQYVLDEATSPLSHAVRAKECAGARQYRDEIKKALRLFLAVKERK